MMTEPNTSPFGNYTNTDERLQELANRLHAWYVASDQLPELFDVALRKMVDTLAEFEDPLDAPADTLLRSFEDALGAYDNILATFPYFWEQWDLLNDVTDRLRRMRPTLPPSGPLERGDT